MHADAWPPGDVLLVFAHPDDEAMFFAPLLCSLHRQHRVVHFLCLSDGDADGLGACRVRELYVSAAYFGVAAARVHVCSPPFEDGMQVQWPVASVREAVARYLAQHPSVRHVVTFDEHGVSGHANHIAAHQGVCALRQAAASREVTTWQLRTRPLLLKYIGVMALLPNLRVMQLLRRGSGADMLRSSAKTTAVSTYTRTHVDVVASVDAVLCSWRAMRCHASQFTWFRKLFVLFSSYTYVCELQRVAA